MAFIETPLGSGSGVLAEGGYVITNAHVVWPLKQVRVVFPDGTEHRDVPVIGLDLLGDIAVIGPLKTSNKPLALTDGEDLPIGSNVFLIGYPAEREAFPQPTMTSGILSRIRQWEGIDMTYLQTDAPAVGGQSGGVLVSDEGEVIGISGFSLGKANFGVVASASDVLKRVRRMSAGKDVSGIGYRDLLQGKGRTTHTFTIHNQFDERIFVINQLAGEFISVTVEGENDPGFAILDIYGNILLRADRSLDNTEAGTATAKFLAPHFVHVWQDSRNPGKFQITSNVGLVPFPDPDDGRVLALGETISGNLDAPGDSDYFVIKLRAGDRIDVKVESANFDPVVTIANPVEGKEKWVTDDDGGRGIFGQNANLIYEAALNGQYIIQVSDSLSNDAGGYLLNVDVAAPGADTSSPIVPSDPTTRTTSNGGDAFKEGFDLRLMLPSQADLPASATTIEQGFSGDPNGLPSYRRIFGGAGGDPVQLGSSNVSVIITEVELYDSASFLRNLLLMINAMDPEFIAEFAKGGILGEGNNFPILRTSTGDLQVDAVKLESPAIGDATTAFLIHFGAGQEDFDGIFLFFAEGRVFGTVAVFGPAGQVDLTDVLPLAVLIDWKILENSSGDPPSPSSDMPADPTAPEPVRPEASHDQEPGKSAATSSNVGLVAHYLFDGDGNDASGNNAHGITAGARLVEDRFGNPAGAYRFDGFNDYFLAQSIQFSEISSQATISMWIKIPKDANGRILRLADTPEFVPMQTHDLVLELTETGHLWLEVNTPQAGGNGGGSTVLADGAWHHLVVGSRQAFVDGQEIGFNGVGDVSFGDLEYLSVGAWGQMDGPVKYLQLTIDDLRIYSRPLTKSEVQALYDPN